MILVTGGAGYIGSHTCHQLVEAGARVICLDNFSSGRRSAIPDGALSVEGSVNDSKLLHTLIKEHHIKTVIHFAGHTIVEESVANPLKYYSNNTMGTLSLLGSCLEGGITNFIFSSTAAVYGNPEKQPVSETAPTSPINPYGRSKLMVEMMLKDLAASTAATTHPFRFVALRYFNVAGARADGKTGQTTPNATHLIKVACETALGLRKKIQVFGTNYPTPDGTCIRDYIHVDDLAKAHLCAIDYLEKGGDSQLLNCGYGRGFSVREVLNMVRKVSGRDFLIEEADRRAGDPVSVTADPTRIKELFGWRPRFDDLETICRTAFEWENKQRNVAT